MTPRRRRRPAPQQRGERITDVDTRLERELLRAVLADGGAARKVGVTAEDFAVPVVRKAFESIAPALEDIAEGTPVDVPSGEGEEVHLLIALATDAAPVADLADALWRVRMRGVDRRIEELRERLDAMRPEDQGYSDVYDELVRLQKSKRERER